MELFTFNANEPVGRKEPLDVGRWEALDDGEKNTGLGPRTGALLERLFEGLSGHLVLTFWDLILPIGLQLPPEKVVGVGARGV